MKMEEDIAICLRYLKTLPAGGEQGADHAVPFPFNIRRNLGIWKLLFLDGKPFVPDPSKSPQWNRGSYLVNALGHCAECHSPRNALGGIVTAQRFAGGRTPTARGWVPNITQKGLGDWSEKDIAYFLETGQTPDGDTAGGSMARVIRNTSQIERSDRSAMALYLVVVAGWWMPAATEEDRQGYSMIRKVGTGFPKRSYANNKTEQDDLKKSHPVLSYYSPVSSRRCGCCHCG